MKEKPILFNGAMIRAILAGTKTQTRRIVVPSQTKPRVAPLTMEPWLIDGEQETDDHGVPCWMGTHPGYPTGEKWFSCPHGMAGDRLWTRETFARVPTTAYRTSTGVRQTVNPSEPDEAAIYRAGWDRSDPGVAWTPSIYMPRWASRITLEITAVRVERLQDITEEDARAEGVGAPVGVICRPCTNRMAFEALWDVINAGFPWKINPWVWCVSFRRIEELIDDEL